MLLLRTSRGVDPGIPLLRSLGSNAHVWLPGANGTTVASLPSNNYLLSDGSTGYSTVDGVDGLTLDGMGALGSEITGATSLTLTGSITTLASTTSNLVVGATYLVTYTYNLTSGSIQYGGNMNVGAAQSGAVSGTYTAYLTAAGAGAGWLHSESGVGTISNLSVKQVTGIHLTQATTANKPLVRRGALNLQDWSENISGATGWASDGMQVGSTVTLPASSPTAFRALKAGAVTPYTAYVASLYIPPAAYWSDPSKRFKLTWFGLDVARTDFTPATVNGGAGGWLTLVCPADVIGAATTLDFRLENLTASTITCSQPFKVQIEAGITAGDYTPTTSTAASNPSAGKYWWSFDGSNDSLLSGNLGITSACTIVIAGRVNSLVPDYQTLLEENTNGVTIYTNSAGDFKLGKTGVGLIIEKTAVIVAGVPFVLTCRLSGGTAVLRKNGVQVATSATAITFSAITGARIGDSFTPGYPLGGALGWVVALPVALSDADCLTVERLVSSQFPNGPVF